MINITAVNFKITQSLPINGSCSQISEKGINGVMSIIMILKVFAVLGINTELSSDVLVRAIDGEEMEVSIISSLVSSPAPATKVGGIGARSSSISRGRSGG